MQHSLMGGILHDNVCMCGYREDRDIKAAQSILKEGLNILAGRTNTILVEDETAGQYGETRTA